MQAATQINEIMKPMRLGGAALGGVGGAMVGDEDTTQGQRLLNTAGGAALGGAALPGMARTLMMAQSGSDALVNGLYYSYLSSPDTIMRANLGAVGAVFVNGLEQLLSGDMTAATKTLGAVKGAGKVWVDSLRGSPEQVRQLRHSILGPGAEGRLDVPDEIFRDVGLGKLFTAGDNAGVYALKEGGMSADEAMRMTLTGTPETQLGQSIVGTQSDWLRSDNVAKRVVAATMMPFARVGVVGMEQGLKRVPGVGAMESLGGPGIRNLFSGTPQARLSQARQMTGVGAAAVGTQTEDVFDPRAGLTVGTAAGPAFLPYTLGREFKRQLQRDPSKVAALPSAIGETAMEFNPMGFHPMGILRRPAEEIPRRLIPSAVSDVAEAVDPAYGRTQGRGALTGLAARGEAPPWMSIPGAGQLTGRVPWAREALPVEYAPVDVLGRPRYDRPEVIPGAEDSELLRGFSRTLFPSRTSALPPAQDLQDPQMRMLYDLGIRPGAPSPRVEMPGLGGKIEMPAQTVGQVQRHRGQARERTAQILSQMAPWLMSLPPQQRAIMASYLNNYINQVQGRATQAGSLALALSGGGQLPRP